MVGVNMAGKTHTVAPSFTGRLACHFATRCSPAPEVVVPSGTPTWGSSPKGGGNEIFRRRFPRRLPADLDETRRPRSPSGPLPECRVAPRFGL
jgi:hypothetical protein